MIKPETIEAWRKIDKTYQRMAIMWLVLIGFDIAMAAWAYYDGNMIAFAVDVGLLGFGLGMLIGNHCLRGSFNAHVAVICSFDGALDSANEHIRMLTEHLHAGAPLAPDPPTMGTRH